MTKKSHNFFTGLVSKKNKRFRWRWKKEERKIDHSRWQLTVEVRVSGGLHVLHEEVGEDVHLRLRLTPPGGARGRHSTRRRWRRPIGPTVWNNIRTVNIAGTSTANAILMKKVGWRDFFGQKFSPAQKTHKKQGIKVVLFWIKWSKINNFFVSFFFRRTEIWI